MSRWARTLDPALLSPYVLDRMRRPVPADIPVVTGSIPVAAFGNPQTSRIATVGINPSSAEFLDASGALMTGEAQRFETVPSIGGGPLQGAEADAVATAVESCYRYFERRPYLEWFKPLDKVLQALGASYWAGSACHLDLVQWATKPKWSGLSKTTRGDALGSDTQFLLDQLNEHQFDLLLLNGRTVVDTFSSAVSQLTPLPSPVSVGRVSCNIYRGMRDATKVIGWSANFQSSWGLTTTFRKALIERVATEAR